MAFIPQDSSIQLNEEHVDYRWCSLEEAKHLTPFTNQHVAYDYIWELFCKAKPNDLLRINT